MCDDLTQSLMKTNVGCTLDDVGLSLATFLCGRFWYLGTLGNCLAEITLHLHKYAVEHGVIYNPLKYVCRSIVFKLNRFSLKCPLVHLGNSVLENQEKAKYLGVSLIDNLNDNNVIMRQMHGLYMLTSGNSY